MLHGAIGQHMIMPASG